MPSDLNRSAHCVHHLVYHLVWCTKYRRPMLTGPVAEDLEDLLYQKAEEMQCSIARLAIKPDHVHVLIECKPTHHIPAVVQNLKGFTSRRLREMYPQLRKLLVLWSPSYFVATVGYAVEDDVIAYIESQ